VALAEALPSASAALAVPDAVPEVPLAEDVECAGGAGGTGPLMTDSVAGFDVVLPTELVNTASNWVPVSVNAGVKVYEVEVAPLIGVKLDAPDASDSHWTAGAGLPDAAAVKVTGTPTVAVSDVGDLVTLGTKSTVSVATFDVVLPTELVNTASYRVPLSPATGVNEYEVEVAPLIGVKFDAPTAFNHCTVGAGLPDAAAVKVTWLPAFTVWLCGWVVTTGL
jgi:hypothetical protein